jgi:hypothetical protein
MKRLGAVAMLLLVLSVAAGCGRKQTYRTAEGTVTLDRKGQKVEATIEGEKGKVTVTGDQSKMTVQNDERTTTVQSGAQVSEADLGIPIYPGAKAEQAITSSSTGEGEAKSITQVHLTTPDSFDKVKAFYQAKLPKVKATTDVSTPEISMFQMTWKEDGEDRTLIVSRNSGDKQTQIVLNRTKEGQ